MSRVQWLVVAAAIGMGGCSNADATPSSSSSSSSSSGATSSGGASSGGVPDAGVMCDALQPCTTGECCDGVCVNIATADHCGSCGVTCGAAQVCLGAACYDATLANACFAATGLIILDEQHVDARETQTVGLALQETCAPFELTEGTVLDPLIVSSTTNLPVARTERMLIVLGGPMVNPVVNAYETASATPVFFDRDPGPGHRVLRNTATHDVVLDVGNDAITDTHDWFLVETFRDTVDGRLVLTAYGLGTQGTAAAGYHLRNHLLPSMPAQTRGWIIVEWAGVSSDGPGAGDTFNVVSASN